MAHIELDLTDRQEIETMLPAKASIAVIAGKLSRHRSTIYREIARNRYADVEMPELDGCYGKISGRMRLEGLPRCVSHETIYSCVYSKDGQPGNLARGAI